MKQRKSIWLKIALGIAIVVFCFVPVMDLPYEIVVQKQVSEQYTTLEPYTVQEQVREPYQSYSSVLVEEPYEDPWFRPTRETTTPATLWHTVRKSVPVTRYRIVSKDVTKYREVTKTHVVKRPVVETRTKRVSVLRYLLR